MAYYAALVTLIQLLKEINHPQHPYLKSILTKSHIHASDLHEKLRHIQELLGDSFSLKDKEATDCLERRIRDAACRALDLIEYRMSNPIPQSNRNHRVRRHLQKFQKVGFEVESIIEELTKLKESHRSAQVEDLRLSSYITPDSTVEGTSKVEAPRTGRNTMVGFEEQLRAIKEQLCGQSVKLEVISIVGMGGLGKTTLARYIFNDKLIDDHFDCCAWVTVSQDYRKQKVLQDIANSMNITEKEGLAEDIRKYLFGRRYLIIIDDIWDIEVWNDIKRIFPDTSDRSRVILTTRMSDVAVDIGNSNFLHQMPLLNEAQSWTLLKQKVFAQEHCPKELEFFGKLIAKNCRGLPLGIVVIAGVLSNVNKTQHNWEEIARAVRSIAIHQNDEHLSSILSLSYNYLPHHLKPCFLYLGVFPEDHEIHISELIRLWVAEEFLKPIESKNLEEVGKEYFKCLVSRNLVLITKKKLNGEFKSCRIHDLLKDLCLQRAHSENFLLSLPQNDNFYRNQYIGYVRRASLITKSLNDDLFFFMFFKNRIKDFSHVRSAIFFHVRPYFDLSLIVSNCKLLRILAINEMGFDSPSLSEMFATGFCKLQHLRYLKLVAFEEIPISPSIFKLQNLQTVIIEGGFIVLPIEIWKMPQLKHLVATSGVELPPIPYGEIRIIDGVPLLRSLQTLHRLHGFKITSDTIEMIPNLKKLKIQYTHMYGDCAYKYWEEFELNNLVHLYQLEILDISFVVRNYVDFAKVPLHKIAFPSSLIKLSLYGCELHWKGMSVVGSLPNLQVLKLRKDSFVGEEWEPIEGEFLKLKILRMEELPYLKYWRAENIHFPCLERLYIGDCNKLDEIPLEIGDIPTLQLIEVLHQNSALISSALKIQEEQWDQGNNDLKVRVIEEEDIWQSL